MTYLRGSFEVLVTLYSIVDVVPTQVGLKYNCPCDIKMTILYSKYNALHLMTLPTSLSNDIPGTSPDPDSSNSCKCSSNSRLC